MRKIGAANYIFDIKVQEVGFTLAFTGKKVSVNYLATAVLTFSILVKPL